MMTDKWFFFVWIWVTWLSQEKATRQRQAHYRDVWQHQGFNVNLSVWVSQMCVH